MENLKLLKDTWKIIERVMKMAKRKGVSWKDVKTELLQDGEFTKAVKEIEPEYELISQIIEARIEQKITQNELAQRVDTKQSNISRLESGDYNPTISFLKKIAEGLSMELHVSFKPKLQ